MSPPHRIDLVQLPRRQRAPLTAVLRRIGFSLALVVFVALVVRGGRGGYVDVTGDPIAEVPPVEVDGRALPPGDSTLVSMIRDGRRIRPAELGRSELRMSDRLVVLRESGDD